MSLIQQALERANKNFYTMAFDTKSVRPIREQEEEQFGAIEKIIEKDKNQKQVLTISKWIFMGICAGAVLGGMVAVWHNMNHFQPAETTSISEIVSPIAPSKASEKSKTPKFSLSGITASGGQRMALINNEIVTAGMILKGDVQVKKILARAVILEDRGKEITLSL